jgi:hypothetical protein
MTRDPTRASRGRDRAPVRSVVALHYLQASRDLPAGGLSSAANRCCAACLLVPSAQPVSLQLALPALAASANWSSSASPRTRSRSASWLAAASCATGPPAGISALS